MTRTNILWTALEIGINFYQGWLFTFFLKRKLIVNLDRSSKARTLATIAVIFAVAAFYSLYIWSDIGITDSVVFLFTYLYSLYVFEDKWYISLFWNAITGLLLVAITSFIAALFINFAGMSWDAMMLPSPMRLSFLILNNVLLFVAYYIISRIHPHQRELPGLSLLLFIILNAVALIAMEMQYNLSWQEGVPQRPVLITIFCLLFMIAGLLVLFELLSSKAREQAELELQIKTAKLKEAHLHEMQSMYQSILEFRHDMKHQLNALQVMIEEGRIEESSTYLDRLRTATMPMSYMTGCVAIDALLSAKVSYMKKLGIAFEFTPYPLNELPMDETAFCAIVGNLLDNAIEAVQRIPNQACENRIYFKLSRTRDMLYITCINSTDGRPLKPMGETFLSSKRKNATGYGILSIRRMVDQAEGICSFKQKDKQFVAEVVLPFMKEDHL